ncbi:cell division protein FtsZ [Truepera radiovictrix]|jgi:cell division protein FtsZ|uniref:Cell division protein FtsZ n=1 Tax=Truepera radiovictrix (strain DSM 17093 / CIP 108686 / LMG 22925 / RQ-24) TaxID=649638 RepID=D7CY91_TRURR|nr:cell division protein FtsZ [Truepera radiovictrix]ADI14730.1 cell division protein FtsZ [Truepera radiovictrix DSM 17093]WMT56720.1 cell division protein FtsZ [Truepera radiovictrix]
MVASTSENAVIRVIGLGGGGNNAVNRMIEAKLEGVQFIAANTDAQVLATSLAENRIQMGDHLTKGLGAGANPEIGEKAALEDRDRIAEQLRGSDLVFITAGMGGGTGTGSAPVVAEISREQGALTIAVVTTPFQFEGPNRMRQAEEGLRKLEDKVDALIVVENQRLLSALDRKVKLGDAFRVADRVLYYGVKGISDVINKPGMINVDFADVRALLSGAGTVLMGIGSGRGEGLVEEAANSATHSPLLARGVEGAHQLLINITGSEELTLFDAHEIVEKISEATEVEDPNVLFGVAYDEAAGDEVRVTVIAAGFDHAPQPKILRPTQFRAAVGGGRSYDPSNYDIPAFLRYNPDDQ